MEPTLLKLRHSGKEPPGGWYYDIPELSVRVKADTLKHLVCAAFKSYAANKLVPPDDLAAIVEDAICQRAPAIFTLGPGGGGKNVSALAVRTATTAVLHALRREGAVAQALADARGNVCANCKANVHTAGCVGCSGYGAWVRSWTHMHLADEKYLAICTISAAMASAVVCASLPALRAAKLCSLSYPENCWIPKEKRQ